MAQAKNRMPNQSSRSEEPAVPATTEVLTEPEMPHIRFAFVVWCVVFSLLAFSIIWDSIYGLLFRTQQIG
jgi:hypothetical protein